MPSTQRDESIKLSELGRPRSAGVRTARERTIMGLLVFCGLFTIGITITIIAVLIGETYIFFDGPHPDVQDEMVDVSPSEFLTSGIWTPKASGEDRHFGIWPLVLSTGKIVIVAMTFALPLGLLIAIWLSEYAKPKVRAVIKPVLEVLAGVPTVVFGFFALTVITPALQLNFAGIHPALGFMTSGDSGWNPLEIKTYNALAAGLAVGIMCLPIVISLSEDALRAVPGALREGAYALGSNKFETSLKVVTPAAFSGIIAAFLLAIARTVGETMIVALAAGGTPVQLRGPDGSVEYGSILSFTDSVQPMTGYMVQVFKGEASHDSIEYYSCYAVAATLFVLTLGITIVGNIIQKRFRESYN